MEAYRFGMALLGSSAVGCEAAIGKPLYFCCAANGFAKLRGLRCLARGDAPDMVGKTMRVVAAGQPCLVVEAVGVIAARLTLAA